MTSWKTYTLKELSKGRGEYGIGAPAVPFDKEKYTYLRITDINDDGTLNTLGMMSVDAEGADKYLLEKNPESPNIKILKQVLYGMTLDKQFLDESEQKENSDKTIPKKRG